MNTSPEKPGITEDTSPTPLTLTKTLGEGSIYGPTPLINTDIDFSALQNEWIPQGRFTWSETDSQGKALYLLNTTNLFRSETEVVPWQVFGIGLASWISYDVELGFLFVKLPNVRGTMDITTSYEHYFAKDQINMNPTMAEKFIIELGEEQFVTTTLHPFYNGMNAWNDATSSSSVSGSLRPNVYTTISVRVPFVPTNLQPKSFEVLVFARFINVQTEGTILRTSNRSIPWN